MIELTNEGAEVMCGAEGECEQMISVLTCGEPQDWIVPDACPCCGATLNRASIIADVLHEIQSERSARAYDKATGEY